MRLIQYLISESLNQPYPFSNFSRNVQFSDKLTGSRGDTGMSASFKTEDGHEYEIISIFVRYLKKKRDLIKKKKDKMDKSSGMMINTLVNIDKSGGIHEVHFSQINELDGETIHNNDVTGTGDSFRIFATVLEFIKELINDRHPDIISIKTKSGEDSRNKLYIKLANKYSSKVGYKVKKVIQSKDIMRIELVKV